MNVSKRSFLKLAAIGLAALSVRPAFSLSHKGSAGNNVTNYKCGKMTSVDLRKHYMEKSHAE